MSEKINETYFNKSEKTIQYSAKERENIILLADTKEEIEKMNLLEVKEYIKKLVDIII